MKDATFICTKHAGKLKIFDREGFDAAIAEYGDGEDLQLSVGPVGRLRTRAQEKFFHGPVLKAFEPLGYHKQEAKDMLCLRFIPKEIHLLDGSVVLVPGRTSALKVEEYNDLIEQCIQLAAENGEVVMDGSEWRARHSTQESAAKLGHFRPIDWEQADQDPDAEAIEAVNAIRRGEL